MTGTPRAPLAEAGSIAGLVGSYRSATIRTFEIVDAYLKRIEAADGRLKAFEAVDAEGARLQARVVDDLRARGVDLGPLMGVPVAIKDIIAVDGMPTCHGSLLDLTDLVNREGGFVRRLRAAGAIILGKTKTVECAFGAAGLSTSRGMPLNPWDLDEPRLTGGSSSGSAVAMAAGLCAFAVGSDTGASIRLPAAFNGVAGQKTTVGLWPTEGAFPLSPTLDSLGTIARSVADLAHIFHGLDGTPVPAPPPLAGLRFGIPEDYFFEGLGADVERAIGALLEHLKAAGCRLVPVRLEGVEERREVFRDIVASEVLGALGAERFNRERHRMDRTVAARIAAGFDIAGWQYFRAKRRQQELERSVRDSIAHVDAVLTPVSTITPPAAAEIATPEKETEVAIEITRCTQPMNIFNLCGASLPIQHLTGERLPIGVQVMGPAWSDARMLAIACALEESIGQGPQPDLTALLPA